MVDRKLDGKAGRAFATKRLNHTENMIDKILETLDELWFVVKRQDRLGIKDGGNGECGSGEDQLANTLAAPSENIRCLVSIEEEDKSKTQIHNTSFSVDESSQPASDNLAPQTNRPRTTMSLQRDSISIKLGQRPCTTHGGNPYYITSKSKRRNHKSRETKSGLSAIETNHLTAKGGDLFVGNSQSKTELEAQEDSVEMERRRSSSAQFYEGRATAL
mmetsp:Transcript_113/g.270  ORF Transcript_113/g.270 Transcript_113/m.270 type:complete len:217 (-) Transcript_113:58-708(-)